MSSTFRLKKRYDEKEIWDQFSDPNFPLGGQENSYLSAFGECTPNYYAVPIGQPYGVKMCVKRNPNGIRPQVDPARFNGYNRYGADLYDPTRPLQKQMYDPYFYWDRRSPHEAENIGKDILRLPIRFNATGLTALHTPAEGDIFGTQRYKEYATDRSFIPDKYNLTQGFQHYPVWKKEQSYQRMGKSELEKIDKRNNVFSSPISGP